ncbi:hypothetical protein A5802_000689 [Enterococcus mundtii]|uniref:Uncharacterized protein n=1 Tax=Enterococcus mundtii TaxID=53346 RepID=A0A242KYC7_ENTMU|nr:hypothetical protein A5802_000689 [Enterococcus mundtii]
MTTNFFPVKVYSLNYRLYSSQCKVDFARSFGENPPVTLYAVLNLNEVRNSQLQLSIYDVSIEKFTTLDQANDRCNELMK